jgi:hypothetical protein
MKIVVDINHPAHVHFFKNFIWEMEERGHQVFQKTDLMRRYWGELGHGGILLWRRATK